MSMPVLRTIHIAALGIGLGTLVMTGIAAAITFPTMKRLEPVLPDFAAYRGEHHRIAAGQIMDRIFHAADMLQIACIALGALTLALGVALAPRDTRSSWSRWLGLARALLMVAIVGLLAFKQFTLDARMDRELRAFWSAAAAGQQAEADAHRAMFDRDHPIASGLLSAMAVLLFLSLAASTLDALAPRLRKEMP